MEVQSQPWVVWKVQDIMISEYRGGEKVTRIVSLFKKIPVDTKDIEGVDVREAVPEMARSPAGLADAIVMPSGRRVPQESGGTSEMSDS
ncbi:hypothetical protein NDU88_004510 [Pleurodeles waltl]|uniref:Uncharacterized protein n=1 Tax=Pleurodeles waltl TaxID=8319 RepID=A0AAV7PG91_PLEWA|nr:hypothetical protein NDU88_004510 [Pleurodeles waltl]